MDLGKPILFGLMLTLSIAPFSSLEHVPMTWFPASFASCTAIWPAPPAAVYNWSAEMLNTISAHVPIAASFSLVSYLLSQERSLHLSFYQVLLSRLKPSIPMKSIQGILVSNPKNVWAQSRVSLWSKGHENVRLTGTGMAVLIFVKVYSEKTPYCLKKRDISLKFCETMHK